MNFSVIKKQRWSLAVLLLAAGLFVSCSKDKNDDPTPPGGGGYPKEVNVTYKVTKVSGNITSCRIDWFNATGGMTTEQNAALPITRSFKRTVKQYDWVTFSVASTTPGSLKLEILVGDDVVETQTFSGTGTFAGTLKYIFP
ncbi:hypothetical protein [Chitinophaga sp. 22620]|uniref:hypothetical protein n=1 Tax=Chitinophaga sp. 22620 TaxID=3453952 RepID=UPI003F85987A